MTSVSQRLTPMDIQARVGGDVPLVCLTAYTTPMAALLDAHCDVLLVGDSVGMVLYGMETTLDVDMEMMVRHGQAVMRGSTRACVVVDMPYGTYEDSAAQAYTHARRLLDETGAQAVKLEGGADMAPTIAHLVGRGIAVMGHIGLMPQSVEKEGGYKIKGRDEASVASLLADARAVAQAGAFAFVLEGTVADSAAQVVDVATIPVIGIGASAACDGQILVSEDMLGLHVGHVAKFVKPYADLGAMIEEAVINYKDEVRGRVFPGEQNLYHRRKAGERAETKQA